MDALKLKLMELQAELCAAMANQKRLLILEMLDCGERSVSEIAEDMDISVSAVSQHLRIMRDKNLVETRKNGNTVFYRIKHKRILEGCRIIREVILEELEQSGKLGAAFQK